MFTIELNGVTVKTNKLSEAQEIVQAIANGFTPAETVKLESRKPKAPKAPKAESEKYDKHVNLLPAYCRKPIGAEVETTPARQTAHKAECAAVENGTPATVVKSGVYLWLVPNKDTDHDKFKTLHLTKGWRYANKASRITNKPLFYRKYKAK